MSETLNLGTAESSKIRYTLRPNQMASQKAGQDAFVARVVPNGTLSLTEMADRIITAGCLAKKNDIIYVLQVLTTCMQSELANGYSINLGGLIRLVPVIKGVFDSENDLFDEKRHAIVISASAGKVIRGVASSGPAQKIGGVAQPLVESISNTVDRQANVLYAGGATADVAGKRLAFDSTAADEGVFISCPEYEGDDLAVTLVKAGDEEITIRIDGAIDAAYTAFLTFKTRQGDKNAEPVELKREVTLKPKPVA